MSVPREVVKGGEQSPELRAEAIYLRASLLDTVTNRMEGMPSDEQPQLGDGGNVLAEGSSQYRFLLALSETIVTGELGVEVPPGMPKDRMGETMAILLTLGHDEASVREQLLNSNPTARAEVEERFGLIKRYGIERATLSPLVSALGGIDWTPGQPAFEPLDEPTFESLVERASRPSHGDGAAGLVIAQEYSDQMTAWYQRHVINEGDVRGYKTVALFSRYLAPLTGPLVPEGTPSNAQLRYDRAASVLRSIPNSKLVAKLGDMLFGAHEYEPTEFALTAEQLKQLKGAQFELEEMYDVGGKPVLRHNLFEKKPVESDEELSEAEAEIYYSGVNILEYLDYLVFTGGCFHPASTRVLQKKASRLHDQDKRLSHTSYTVAVSVWESWRNAADRYSAQEVLDAWTIAEYAI